MIFIFFNKKYKYNWVKTTQLSGFLLYMVTSDGVRKTKNNNLLQVIILHVVY